MKKTFKTSELIYKDSHKIFIGKYRFRFREREDVRRSVLVQNPETYHRVIFNFLHYYDLHTKTYIFEMPRIENFQYVDQLTYRSTGLFGEYYLRFVKDVPEQIEKLRMERK